LLLLFGPGRHDSVHARVGDGLAEVFARVSGDQDEGAAVCSLLTKHLERLVEVRIAEGKNSLAEVGEGILQCLNGFRFVARASHDGLEIDVGGGWCSQHSSDAIVGGYNVGVDFPHGTNTLGGAPSVLLGGHSLGQASISLLIEGDFRQELGAGTAVEGVCSASLPWAWVTGQKPRESVASDRQQIDIRRIEEISSFVGLQKRNLSSTELSINRVE
jgi:hypothetical protein